jgi:hypothetical protein
MNFTWWVNRKDVAGRNVFQGGFLGLDNIGPFDRGAKLPDGAYLAQSDGTSWMGVYALNMLAIAIELANARTVYEDIASKFFEHFLIIADAMNSQREDDPGLWDEQTTSSTTTSSSCRRASASRSRCAASSVSSPIFAVETISSADARGVSRTSRNASSGF